MKSDTEKLVDLFVRMRPNLAKAFTADDKRTLVRIIDSSMKSERMRERSRFNDSMRWRGME